MGNDVGATARDERGVDVVIVAYRSEAVIGHCVRLSSEIPGVRSVLVVDHGDGESADVAEHAGAVALRDPGNPGFGAGQNRGVARGSAPFVLLLNPDADLIPAAVQVGVDWMLGHSNVAAVQGVILNQRTGLPERSQGTGVRPIHLLGRAVGARRLLALGLVRALARRVPSLSDHVDRAPAGPAEVDNLSATALLVRREAFEQIGGFDPRYFLYGEDLDLCRRLRANGWKLVALPDQWARHDAGASSAGWWDRELVWWQGTMLFSARWFSAGSWAVGVLAAVLRALTLIMVRPSSWRRVWRALLKEPARTRREPGPRAQSLR